jgi:hemerythrin
MTIDRELFRTGIPLIDHQHDQYLDLVDELFVLCLRPKARSSSVQAGLKRTLAYALDHFDAEEALMRSVAFRGYEKHRLKHDEFRDESDRLLVMCKQDLSPELQLTRLTRWLVEWFCEQTQVYDRALAAYLKKRKSRG